MIRTYWLNDMPKSFNIRVDWINLRSILLSSLWLLEVQSYNYYAGR